MKKIFTLLTLLLCAVTSSWAATVSDLKTIATDYVFIADNITSNGTAGLTANTLYDGNVIFAPTANTVSTGKGSVTFEGGSHLNSLRIKNAQDRLAFKVNGACTVTFYTQSNSTRGLYVSKSDNVTADANAFVKQTASTPSWVASLDAAGVYYLTSYGGDFYIAGFKVEYSKTGQPTIGTNPVSAEYSQGDAATALSVSATAANSGALSYQWYKNESCQSVLAGEGATAIDGANSTTYAPSTATAGTTYYFCKVTEEGNANVATTKMAKVLVNPAGFNVTYSLGEVTGTVGILPEGASHVTSVTIPVNKTLYKDGYTLTAWNDGTADHAIGSTFDITSDITLTPVFTANGASTYLGHNASTVTWDFQTKNGAPTWQLEGNTGVQVAQTTVGGSSIDVKLDIDATSGKLNNASWTDWAQFNAGTKLTVPVLNGAVVKLFTMNEGTGTTFGGSAADSYASNIFTYTATADGDLEVVAGTGVSYVRYISVTYPSETALLTVSANNTEIALTKASINDVDYLTAVTDNWQTGKTYGDYTGDFVNMSKAERYITVNVTGASFFQVLVQNSSSGRTYLVKVGDSEAQQVTHGGTGVESSGVFAIADPTAETTIKISGGGSSAGSVYPVAINFNPAVSASISEYEWATFVSDKALDFTDSDVKAYVVTDCSGSAIVKNNDVKKIPANTPLLLNAPEGTYAIPVTNEPGTITTNLLVAGPDDYVGTVAGKTRYVLSVEEGKAQFMKIVSDVYVYEGKAYLEFNEVIASRTLGFDDDVTAIKNMKVGSEDNIYYDLQGRRVLYPTKGLYIVNGKKVIIK
jgi:hypothetical protein